MHAKMVIVQLVNSNKKRFSSKNMNTLLFIRVSDRHEVPLISANL